MKNNLWGEKGDPGRTFLREDWEGADCQVYFNDPETDELEEGGQLYESQYEWLDVEYKLAAARDLVVVGPTCLSAKARSQESDGSENSDDLSESDDEAEGELADGL